MSYDPLLSVSLQGGLDASAAPLSPASEGSLDVGSWNAICSADGFVKPWSGASNLGAGTGSAKLLPFGNTWGGIKSYGYTDNTFSTASITANAATTTTPHGWVTGITCTVSTAGTLPTGLVAATTYYLIVTGASAVKFASTLANALLGTAIAISNAVTSTVTIDVSNASVTASGNWMQDIGLSRWGIGSGQPMIAGVAVPGFQLSTNLQVQIAVNGVYGPPVDAGLAQPSAPGLGIINITGDISNSMSAKIARSRPSTGAISVASPTSVVVVPQANRLRVTFPAAATGQTHWRAYFPFQGFGGVGVHYLAEYAGNADIPEATVAAGSTSGSQATGTLTLGVNPTAAETIAVNGITFTFIAGASTSTDVHIGASADDTAANFAAVLNASVNAAINIATYTVVTNVVTITYDTQGVAGNAYTLANSSGANVTRSTPTLTGGVDGISRSLEFNFKDGDLIPIEASYDDYPPPAATHAIRLNTVMNLVGCYADSSTGPSASNTGTAIAVSKENNYESYVPTSLLYLPEQVVDVLARPLDDYGYVGCQNSIHAIQYVGNRGDELPSCTLTTILPDIGVQYQHNWCAFRGKLLIYTAQGNLILMDESGTFDTSFANPVTKILKNFTTVSTAVGYDPINDSIVIMSGKQMLAYSLQNGMWRQIWLPDYYTAAVQATGTYNIGMNPTDGDTISFYGTTFTFVNILTPGSPEIEIQVSLSVTVGVAVATLNNYSLGNVPLATYTQTGSGEITITYDLSGTGGNSYTLGTNTGNIVRSAATLAGGAAAVRNIPGTCLPSCTTAQRKLYFSMTNSSVETAFTYDTGSGNVPISLVSNYQNAGGVVVNDIYEMAIAAQTSVSTQLAVAVNRNLTKTAFRQISTAGSTTITDAESSFTSDMTGKRFILFGPAINGADTILIRGILTYVSASTCTSSVSIPATLTDCLMFVGNFTAASAISAPTHIPNFFPNLPELRSFSVATWIEATGLTGNVLTCDLLGTKYASSRAIN